MALWIILLFAAVGVGVGIALSWNGVVGYGLANQFGKQHMKKLGVEDDGDTNDRWDA